MSGKTWKVKLYKLNGSGDWIDNGIGQLGFDNNEINITEEHQVFFNARIKDEVYHKQGDTILTWTSSEKMYFALSFADKISSQEVLAEICKIQKKKIEDVPEDEGNEYYISKPTKNNLEGVLDELVFGVREKLETDILTYDFVNKIEKVFKSLTEDEVKKKEIVFLIFKQMCNRNIVQLGSVKVIDSIINEYFDITLKIMKYDPDLNSVYYDIEALYTQSKFANPLDIKDEEFLKKIEKINKLVFIKDTALTRSLDESGCAFLILELQSNLKELITLYTKSKEIRNSLYESVESLNEKSLDFLIELCNICKTCSVQERHILFDTFFHDGIMNLVEKNSLRLKDKKSLEFLGDFYCSIIDVSPFIIRNLFFNSPEPQGNEFLHNITEILFSNVNVTITQDLCKLFKNLLDPNSGIFDKIKPIFYPGIAEMFIGALKSPESLEIFPEIFEIFSYCIEKHEKSVILPVLQSIIPLFKSLFSISKHVSIGALKLIKSIILKNDKSLNVFMLRKKIFDHVLDMLEQNSVNQNMVFSLCLSICMKAKDCTVASSLKTSILSSFKKLGLEFFSAQFSIPTGRTHDQS